MAADADAVRYGGWSEEEKVYIVMEIADEEAEAALEMELKPQDFGGSIPVAMSTDDAWCKFMDHRQGECFFLMLFLKCGFSPKPLPPLPKPSS